MTLHHKIKNSINAKLQPILLELIDESHLHANHPGAKIMGGGHFVLHIVSYQFEGLSPLKRHRLVYDVLKGEFKEQAIHALSLKCLSPTEYRSQPNQSLV